MFGIAGTPPQRPDDNTPTRRPVELLTVQCARTPCAVGTPVRNLLCSRVALLAAYHLLAGRLGNCGILRVYRLVLVLCGGISAFFAPACRAGPPPRPPPYFLARGAEA